MTEARIVAVLGAMCAALLATWVGNEIFSHVGNSGHFYDPFAIWKVWGAPAAIAAVVATFRLTKRNGWLPERWRFAQLLGSASRCAGFACLLYIPIQIVCMLLLASSGMTDGWSSGFGVVGDSLLIVYMDAIAIAFGILPAIALQMIVLLLARAMASGVGLETQSTDEERVES